ncbi:MAG: D-alanyl-D-alanine carboxypeptidase/D-alanyl-D-alanine-endopeptidase [Bacteroidales bacterium]|nr:D-alanyl-D-alanine carboxypeptidase/D-alanyl-D-alanine-endopeptidase [Bacteroidales bacterium]MCI1786389.1 D-alanyl-D-alanine carboxypeptidase/D-alanyl-D-alanine-endopeptidase [Bacteroidales bacterium]
MRKSPISLAMVMVSAMFGCASVYAQPMQSSVRNYIDSVAGSEPLRSSLFSVLAVNSAGDTLAVYNSSAKMLPASNTKLITTGTALCALGPDFRFKTEIGYSGRIKNGTLYGDIYIIGGGDPTIASSDSIAVPADSLFSEWESFISGAGIRKIKGRIIGDGRYFDGPIENGSWAYDDLGTDYGTGGNGLCFFENVQQFSVAPGDLPGDPVKISPLYPDNRVIDFRNNAVTTEAGKGDGLVLVNTDMCPVAEIRGGYAVDEKPSVENFSNKFGAFTCASAFSDYLVSKGLYVTGDPADIDAGNALDAVLRVNLSGSNHSYDNCRINILGETYSAPLEDIIKSTNYKSDNFYAETLLRTLGKNMTGSSVYDSCIVAENNVLESMGIDISRGVRLVDGSGLSRHDYVSPDFFCRFLGAMAETDFFDCYLHSLPQPGSGTLSRRLPGRPESVRKRIHMKSGSMDGVLCYSGYIIPEDGDEDNLVIFSIMTNNCVSSYSAVASVIDGILEKLVQ